MRKRGFILFLVGAVVLLAGGMIPVSVLEVKDGKSGEILFHKRAVAGDVFLFSYIHSVEKTPVEGTFRVEKGGALRIVETRFSSYGPGLPNVAEKTLRKNEEFITEGSERLDKFKFLFIPMNRPILKFKGKAVALGNDKREGGLLEISIRHYPFIFHIFKEL